MTLEEVRRELKVIEAASDDDETAHSMEDELRDRVLREIAEGADNAKELANEVLKSAGIKFCRWCA